MPETKLKTFRLQFGLRSILLITTLFAILFCSVGLNLHEGHRHRQIAKELQVMGCSVEFTHNERQTASAQSNLGASGNVIYYESTLPSYIESFGMAPVFRRIKGVHWQGNQSDTNTKKVVQLLKTLKQIESFSLVNNPIPTNELSDLMNSIQTHKLALSNVALARTEINWLNRQKLTWLSVFRTQFSNPAIDDLPDSLEYLNASRTRISDEGLPGFVRLKNLKQLRLNRTPTSQAAIMSLQKEMPWCQITWEQM